MRKSRIELLTRRGLVINPLDVQSHEVSLVDMVHALSYQPMFGGMCRMFYSKSEHLINMYDAFCDEPSRWIDQYYPNIRHRIYNLPINKIKLAILFYYGGHAYLSSIIGMFESYKHHNPRLIGALLSSIGEEYKLIYKPCIEMFEGIDTEIQKSVKKRYNDLSFITMNPFESMKNFVVRYNKHSDIHLTLLGTDIFENKPTDWKLPISRI